jgi:hypothetical protein
VLWGQQLADKAEQDTSRRPRSLLNKLSGTAAATAAGLTLPYPQQKFAAEFAIQWLFLLVEPSRLFLGESVTRSWPQGLTVMGCNIQVDTSLQANAVRLAGTTQQQQKPLLLMQWRTPHRNSQHGWHACSVLYTTASWCPAAAALALHNMLMLFAAASKGNKTEQSAPLLFSILLSLPMIAFHVYYLQFQTYV